MAEFEAFRNYFSVRQMEEMQDSIHAGRFNLSAKQKEWMAGLMANYDERGMNGRATPTAMKFLGEIADGKYTKTK